MRERIEDQLKVSDAVSKWDYYHSYGSSCLSESYSSDWVNGSYSRMVDAGSSREAEPRTRYLEHHRSEIQSFPCDFTSTFDSATCGRDTFYHVHGRLGPGYHVKGNPWQMDSSAINQALLEAFRFFEAGCVPQETLLANFAIELPDVKSLWPTFRDLFVAKPGQHMLRSLKDLKRDVKKDASAYLAYEFGVLPLIGDVMRIYDTLKSLDNHIKWLRENSGKPVKVIFRTSLPKPVWVNPVARPADAPTGAGGYWRKVTELRSGLKAWATITYDVSELSNLQLKIRSLVRSFGLNNPAAVLWEALPYSFVVDWFTKVGNLFAYLEVPIVLPCVFHDCGYGAWSEGVFEDYYTSWGITTLLRRTRVRGYSRRPGIPIGISSLSIESPTAKQLVLGLALITQKF